MKAGAIYLYNKYMASILSLNFKSFQHLQQVLVDEAACVAYLEELIWEGVPVSPFDKTSKVYKCKNGKYKCKNTGKYFNVKTGTIFENTKISLRQWFMAIYLLACHKKGVSSLQLAQDIGVTQKTAWFMLHKIRKCLGIENNNIIDKEVELDETYVGGLNKNRHKDKKVKYSQGRSYKDKTPVFGMIQRGGKLSAWVVPNVKTKTLTNKVLEFVKRSAEIYTDEWQGYNLLKNFYENHTIVEHGKKQYVKDKAYTNTMEGAWALLKKSLKGIYHVVSKKYLQGYVNSWIFCYNTRKMSIIDRFCYGLMSCCEMKFTYAEVINGY